MNALQIGLIGIGVLVVAILFAWQWWQGRRASSQSKHANTPSAQATATHVPPAPLHDLRAVSAANQERGLNEDVRSVRIEPTFDSSASKSWQPAVDSTQPPAPAPMPEPTLPAAPAPVAPLPVASTTKVFTREAPLAHEPLIDVAPLVMPERPRLVSEWPFDERLHVHASIVSLSGGAFDAAPFVATAGRAAAWFRLFRQSPWESFDPAHVVSAQHLVLALPLASRAGPIDTPDIDAWRFLLTELATTLGCEAQFFGFRDGPVRAAELDSFLAAVDIIPVVYVVKKDGGHWPGTRLRSTLEANGFRLQSDGRFSYHEIESDAVIFYAVDGFERPFTPERLRTESITALRCMLEPVRLVQPMVRFDMFRQSLRALSKLLDAELKNSEGEPLGEPEFALMRDEVKTAMDALVGAGIEPGSDTARSLFS